MVWLRKICLAHAIMRLNPHLTYHISCVCVGKACRRSRNNEASRNTWWTSYRSSFLEFVEHCAILLFKNWLCDAVFLHLGFHFASA